MGGKSFKVTDVDAQDKKNAEEFVGENMSNMKLNDAKLHKTMSIVEVDDCEYTHKLSVLGFVSGCRVCPLMDLDGTLLVDIKGCHYAMSQEIAEHINVEEER